MNKEYCFFDGGRVEFDDRKSVRELIQYAFNKLDYYEPLGMDSSLLLDYINMLSAKKHVICLVFIDRQNSIDILKELDQIKNWTESFKVMPTNKVDNKIKVYLSFYNSQYSKKYEVDLAAQLFLY